MQAALHQQFALRLADDLDRFGGCRVAVRHIDDLRAFKRDAVLLGNRLDLVGRTDQHSFDDARLGRLDRAAQRGFVARMHDNCRGRRRNALGPRDEAVVFRPWRRSKRAKRRNGILITVCDTHFVVLPR